MSTSLSSTPSTLQDDTATNMPTKNVEQHPAANDIEKQPIAPPAPPTFPEGSFWGWSTLFGSWLIMFVTFGYANAFGVFQSYYATGYPNQTASDISWVGSVQIFLQFSMGAIVGPLFDKGYFRYLMVIGTVIYVVCFFMVSLCKEFWQTVLCQAIGVGIGIGFLFLPAISIIPHYFHRRRALAIGIAATGSSTGGICLPIMLNNLIAQHGFKLAVQYTGYLLLGCLVIANLCMRTRLPPKHNDVARPSPRELFASVPYSFLVAGLFLVSWGIYFPIYYLQVFGEEHGISENITFYTLAILSAASIFGRTSPNFLADSIGSLNLLTFMTLFTGVTIFAIFGAGSPGGLIVVTILYGFFQGAFVSLFSPALISFSKSIHEIGLRIGMGMLIMSFAALTGTPITGALLDRYGFYAPTIWSGVMTVAGGGCFGVAAMLERRRKRSWKV
nr:uncharacterized protein CI109_006463 [Kwoniella shandongensis]KAA5525194.1 hypothetical protein CI109_006463 [Kwoniella shandongensis]